MLWIFPKSQPRNDYITQQKAPETGAFWVFHCHSHGLGLLGLGKKLPRLSAMADGFNLIFVERLAMAALSSRCALLNLINNAGSRTR